MWNNIKDNPIVSSTGDGNVKFKFKCRNCPRYIETDSINVPSPNFSGDNEEQSTVNHEESVICDCGEEHELSISNGTGGMYVNISGVKESDIFYEIV